MEFKDSNKKLRIVTRGLMINNSRSRSISKNFSPMSLRSQSIEPSILNSPAKVRSSTILDQLPVRPIENVPSLASLCASSIGNKNDPIFNLDHQQQIDILKLYQKENPLLFKKIVNQTKKENPNNSIITNKAREISKFKQLVYHSSSDFESVSWVSSNQIIDGYHDPVFQEF